MTQGKDKSINPKALKELKTIRDTGKFNMLLERRFVMQYANKNKMYSLINCVGNDRKKYLKLLKNLGNEGGWL